jgi:hypothetical protein
MTDPTNPAHYRRAGQPEVIDMMLAVYGRDAVAAYCLCAAFKYRARVGHKPGQDVAQEVGKALWYEAFHAHLMHGGPDPRVSASA